MSHKEKALVICPGRGTYTKAELGYLRKYRPGIEPFLNHLDARLTKEGQPSVTALDDAEKFSLKTHTPGEYASTLIYACSAADFFAIDRERYEIVAVTGNSMGWYTALAVGGALSSDSAFSVIHTMGSMMKDGVIGGQLIYPVVDESWNRDPQREAVVAKALEEVSGIAGCEVYTSIQFGGYAILGGTQKALKALMQALPVVEDGKYPFILVNHAAFHTPLMHEVSARSFAALPSALFEAPRLPLIDGRGKVWQPYGTNAEELREYTLGHQVYAPYDFTTAISVALKEFAPTKLILLGPGASSGGALAQILIENRWLGLSSKKDFQELQAKEPFLLSMGRAEQQSIVARV